MRCLSNQVVLLAGKRRRHVIESAERLTAVGESTISRHRDAVRVVTSPRRRQIVARQEAAVPGAVIRDIESHVLPQLVLDGDRALPVVALLVETCQRIVRAVCAGAAEAEVVP